MLALVAMAVVSASLSLRRSDNSRFGMVEKILNVTHFVITLWTYERTRALLRLVGPINLLCH